MTDPPTPPPKSAEGRAEPSAEVALWRLPGMRRLVLVGVLAFSGFFLTLSSLPLWAVQGGSKPGSAGLVTTVMLVSTVSTQIAVPALVRRFGVAGVLCAGLVTLGGPAPLLLLSNSFGPLLVLAALRGTGFAVITVLMPLAATRLVGVRRRGEAIGLYGLAIAVPNLLAVPGGVALTGSGHFALVATMAAAPLLALPFVRSMVRFPAPVPASTASIGQSRPAGSVREATTTAGPVVAATGSGRAALLSIAGVTIVLLTVTLAGGAALTFLPIVAPIGAVATTALLLFGVTGAFARWYAGRLADRLGSGLLLPLSIGVAAAGTGVVAVGISTGVTATIFVGALLLGTGYGATQNISLIVAFNRAGPAHQTTASAAWNAAFDTGTAIGALAVGLVAGAGIGFGWAFAGCAAFIALTIPLGVRATRK